MACARFFFIQVGLAFVTQTFLPVVHSMQCTNGVLGKSCGIPPRDCMDLLNGGQKADGVYMVYPKGSDMSFPVYCDMTTDGGGWLVFQRRVDGNEDFYRNWADYEKGFGNQEKEFWLGNYKLYLLTTQTKYQLRVDMEDFELFKVFAKYSEFSVAGPMDNYRLFVTGFSGSKLPKVRDSFSPIHSNHTFSTKDFGDKIICANSYKGGWWFNHCHAVHLNGVYLNGENAPFANGIIWSGWKGNNYSLKKTEMKFRPAI